MSRLNIVELILDLPRDRSEIHALLADGTQRQCYRVKSSHLSGTILFRALAREHGLTIDESGMHARKPGDGPRVAANGSESACEHARSVTTRDGNGAFCGTCGETLA